MYPTPLARGKKCYESCSPKALRGGLTEQRIDSKPSRIERDKIKPKPPKTKTQKVKVISFGVSLANAARPFLSSGTFRLSRVEGWIF